MKAVIILAAAGFFLAGCASTETGTAYRGRDAVYAVDDQPQTATAGEGSLMPGAYDSRGMQPGQFTGRERTNDQIGQRPTLPRETDPRELVRDSPGEKTPPERGAGTLGQSGTVPNQPVTAETLLEKPAQAEAQDQVPFSPRSVPE